MISSQLIIITALLKNRTNDLFWSGSLIATLMRKKKVPYTAEEQSCLCHTLY